MPGTWLGRLNFEALEMKFVVTSKNLLELLSVEMTELKTWLDGNKPSVRPRHGLNLKSFF